MGRVDFGKTKDRIAIVESTKNEKRKRIKNLYNNIVNNQEILDILMIQIGKDIEEKFPDVKFRLISRIKSEKSLSDKLENDLAGLVDKKKIDDVNIYDIAALSIIIEEVPDEISTNDQSFNSHIADLIKNRKYTMANLKMHENQIEEYKRRLESLKQKKKEKIEAKKINDKKIEELSAHDDKKEIAQYLELISKALELAVEDMDEHMEEIKRDRKNMEIITERTKDRYDKENNECNHTLADFIIRNLTKMDNVKTLGLTDIPKRLKQKENYDGYRATHNSYQLHMTVNNEDGKKEEVSFICEIQGKSLDAFYVADRGKAAKYHTNQTEEPGKIVKRKILPNTLNYKSKKEVDALRKEVEKIVPQYRIYRHTTKKNEHGEIVQDSPEIYKLSAKESFILYYSNQLLGNDTLDIPAHKEILDDVVKTSKLSDKAQKYKNYDYEDVNER